MIGVQSMIFAPIVGTLLLGVLRLVPLAFVVVTLMLFIFARLRTTIVSFVISITAAISAMMVSVRIIAKITAARASCSASSFVGLLTYLESR